MKSLLANLITFLTGLTVLCYEAFLDHVDRPWMIAVGFSMIAFGPVVATLCERVAQPGIPHRRNPVLQYLAPRPLDYDVFAYTPILEREAGLYFDKSGLLTDPPKPAGSVTAGQATQILQNTYLADYKQPRLAYVHEEDFSVWAHDTNLADHDSHRWFQVPDRSGRFFCNECGALKLPDGTIVDC